jgi:hypothetical protein
LEQAMVDVRSRSGILVGLAAAVSAFGAAAMMAAATAPAARADLDSEITDAIDYNLSSGQTAFDLASTDFAGGDVTGGLTALFDGVDDDLLYVPQNAFIGGVDVLTDTPGFSAYSSNFLLTEPTDFSQAETFAQSAYNYGEGLITNALSDFGAGDYGVAAFLDTEGSDYAYVLPLELLVLGGAASF